MGKELVFHCPRCKCQRRLEEVRVDAVIYVPIEQIEQVDEADFNVQYDYGHEEEHDSRIDRFQCFHCGFVIENERKENICDQDDLVDWLKSRPENQGG